MLYLSTALYEEAAPLIQYYSLKQDVSLLPFEIFRSEEVILLVTKPGSVRAAVALSHLFTLFPPASNDFFLSVGTAGCPQAEIAVGTPFLIHKLTDRTTGRTMYPELLFTAPFSEAALITVPTVQTQLPDVLCTPHEALFHSTAPLLYDMEGSAIYEAAVTYFDTHQFAFLRIVSDHMQELAQTNIANLRQLVTSCIQKHTPTIVSWLSEILLLLPEDTGLTEDEQSHVSGLAKYLCCSVSMQNSLKQLFLYLKRNLPQYPDALSHYLDIIQPEPCTCRKEGKRVLEQLRNHFL